MNPHRGLQSVLRWALRYGMAVAAVAAMLGLRLALTAWVGPGLPTYITFYPAVMAAALLAGFGPGLMATGLTAVVAAYWILPPEGFAIGSPVERLGVVLFCGMGLFMSGVAEFYRRNRRKAIAYDQETALRETRREKEFLADVLEHASQPFATGYPDGRLGLFNRAYEELTGYSADELRALNWTEALTPPEWRGWERQRLEELHHRGEPVRYEKEYTRKDGTRVPIELLVHLVKDAGGQPEYYYSFLTDISERKRKEEELRQLNRTLDALRHSNEAMMHADREEDYLAEVCRIVTQDCGHAMVWIGYARQDEGQTIQPVAHAGIDDGYLETLRLTWADTERGRGPTGTAIRTARPDGCRNVLTDPRFAPWREEAGKRGYASSLAVPLQSEDRAFGAITIYSRQPDAFSEDEVQLLAELADDLAYGIAALRLRAEHARAEQALRESEERFKAIAANTPDHLLVQDLDLRYTLVVNPQLGLTEQDMLGKADGDILNAADAERLTKIKRQVIETGNAVHVELPLTASGGQTQVFSGAYVPKRDAAGKVDGLIGYFRNITERKQAEAALASQRQELQVIIESVPAMIFYKDKENHFLRTNKAFEDAMGLPKEKLQGQSLFDLYPRAMAEAFWNDDKQVMASRKPKYGIIEPMQTPRGVRTVQTDKIPYFDESGNVIGVIGFALDITERQQAEESLHKINEELEQRVTERTGELRAAFQYARNLLEASLDPLVTISPDGRITDVNQATELVTGVGRTQLVGSNFSNYFTEPARADAGYQKVLADGLVRDYPLSIRHTSGRVTEVLYHATVYRDEAGRVQGVFAAARDITERVVAEKRREITQSLLELFAHKASGKEYFDAVVQVIRAWTDCQCLGIRVLDERGDIPYEAAVGFDPEFLRLEGHLSVKSDDCFCIRAISQSMVDQDRPLLTAAGSLRCDDTPGFMRQLAPVNRGRYRGTCVKWGFASLAVIPIRYRDQVLGAIHLADRRPNRFPPATIEFLEAMTPLIGEAIQRFHAEAELSRHRDHLEELVRQRTAELEAANRRLQQAEASLQQERDQLEIHVRERTADLSAANRALEAEMAQRQRTEKEHKKLLRRLADAQENERARISRELHDRLGQELTALKLGLRLLKNQGAAVPPAGQGVGKLEQLAGELMQTVHRLAWELHPAVLDDLGLETALRRYTFEWSEKHRLPIDFHCHGGEPGRLPRELEMALYRVAQEALTNILKHANAKRVSVLLERQPDRVALIVEDDGVGFDAAAGFQAARGRGNLGLLGMRERVTLAGGTIEIESAPGSGTTVFARIPLDAGRPPD